MKQVIDGYEITTASNEAAEQTKRGIESFIEWRMDPFDWLDRALETDPDCVFASLVKGLLLVTARSKNFAPIISECIEHGESREQELGMQETLYFKALKAMSGFKVLEALEAYEALLRIHPRDLMATRMLQAELFWMGESRWMHRAMKNLEQAWKPEMPGSSYFYGDYAFAHEEAGFHETAERFGRMAVELDPSNVWAAHAVAHVLEMQNRADEGVDWLSSLSGGWDEKNQIVHHAWWHRCLFHLERGESDEVFELFSQEVRNPESPRVKQAPEAYVDVQNTASLLMRMELAGFEVGERWSGLVPLAESRLEDHTSPFTSIHALIILAKSGMLEKARTMIGNMLTFTDLDQGPIGNTYRQVVVPAAEAVLAFVEDQPKQVLERLMPIRFLLYRMGGSHAQRDLFWQMMTRTALQLEDRTLLGQLHSEIRDFGFSMMEHRRAYAGVF